MTLDQFILLLFLICSVACGTFFIATGNPVFALFALAFAVFLAVGVRGW